MSPLKSRFTLDWKEKSRKYFLTCCGLAISLLLPLLGLFNQPVLSYFDNKLYDEFLARQASGKESSRVVIVDIDERSMQLHGQWPWPRAKIATIVEAAHQGGAAAIGLDIIFAEKERASQPILTQSDHKDDNRQLESFLQKPQSNNDLHLASVISKSPVVLGYHFHFTPRSNATECHLHPLQLTSGKESASPELFEVAAEYATCNLDVLSASVARSGFLNISPDVDGLLRQAPLVIAYENQFYPSLGLAAVMQAKGLDYLSLRSDFADYRLRLGEKTVPLNSNGMLLLNYRGAGSSFPYVSASEVLSGTVEPSFFAGKVVLVGTSAVGLNELRATPFDPLFPGVEVHATVVDNLLAGDFLSRPSSAHTIEFLTAIAGGLFYLLLVGGGGARRSLAVFILFSLLLGCAAYFFFFVKGIYLSPILPFFVLATHFTVLNLLKFRIEEIRARKQTEKLVKTQGALIEGMASLTESRHLETGQHIKRTQEYIRILARLLQKIERYRERIDNQLIELLYITAPLHDIGKVGIPDAILLKQGRLTTEEFEIIKEHAKIGKDVLVAVSDRTDNDRFITVAHDLVYAHHEKWDGSGYPRGLKGEEIPLAGRMMAIVDMYDALTSKRVYKEKFSHEKAIEIMTEHYNSFDPCIFSVFLKNNEIFRQVALDCTPIE